MSWDSIPSGTSPVAAATSQVAANVVGRFPFVGRYRELSLLRETGLLLREGIGGLVLIAGEAGIGKTRLAEAFATDSSTEGSCLLWGRCWERPDAPPFWPWTQIIRSYLNRPEGPPLQATLGRHAADLARLLPELRKADSPQPTAGVPDANSSDERFRVFDTVAQFLKTAAASQPLLLILDDLHWADKPSLVLLEFLASELERSGILIVGTYRDAEVGSAHPLRQALGELTRHVSTRRHTLEGLDHDAISVLLSTVCHDSSHLAGILLQRTEGNPFFLIELIRLLATETGATSAKLRTLSSEVPPTVRDVILRRLRYLSPQTLIVLSAAAVAGREFDFSILQASSGLRSDDLIDSLEDALRSRVLVEVPAAIGRYRFVHVLLRDTLYGETSLRRRLAMHRTIATVLEDLHATDLDPYSAELAFHYLQCAPADGVGRCLDFTVRAGRHASRHLAYEEAANHYSQALDLLKTNGPDLERRCELLLSLGDAQNHSGEWLRARATYRAAAELARQLGLPEALASAAIGFKGLINSAGPVDHEAVALLEAALAALGERQSFQRVRILHALSASLTGPDERMRCEALSDTAVTLAHDLNDSMALALALWSRLYSTFTPASVQTFLAIADQILIASAHSANPELRFEAHLVRYAALLQLHHHHESSVELANCQLISDELRHPRFTWQMSILACGRSLLLGDLAAAASALRESARLAQCVPHTVSNHYFHLHSFLLARAVQSLPQYADQVRSLCNAYPAIVYYRIALAAAQAAEGDTLNARKTFSTLMPTELLRLANDKFFLWSVAVLSDVCSFLADMEAAAVIYDLARPYADQNVVVAWGAACDGPVAHYLGVCASVLERWTEAESHFKRAIDRSQELQAPLLVARTQLAYTEMLLRRRGIGDSAAASESCRTAIAIYVRLNVPNCLESALHLQAQLSLDAFNQRPTPSHNPRLAHIARLNAVSGTGANASQENTFRREGEYWTLCFEGRLTRVRNSRGIQYLSQLLSRPHQSVHALDLTGACGTPGQASVILDASERHRPRGDLTTTRPRDLGLLVDARALQEYRARLRELQSELDEAEQFADLGRASALRRELDQLTHQLAATAGRDGRPRRTGSYAERARISVRNSITTAIKTIARHDPVLARHLSNAVHTGTFCSYVPDRNVLWNLSS